MSNLCSYGCGKEGIYHLKNGKFCCSKSCSGCSEMKKKNSEARKKQIAEQKLNGTFKCNFSKFGHTAWNKGLTKETDERVKKSSETYKNNYKAGKFKILRHSHTIETKDKLSEIRSKYLEKCPNGFPDVGWYKIQNVNGEEFTVRGTWERDFGNYLTLHKILWIRNVYLKYIKSDGSIHRYNPDFYLPELDLYIEVKGYFSEKDKLKTKLVLEQNKINLKFVKEAGIMLIRNNLDEELDKILVNFN